MNHAFRLICLLLALLCPACRGNAPNQAARPVPGVDDHRIILGSSLALSGHAGYLGTQTLRGAMAYIRHVNETGGVHGRRIDVRAYDDAYDPPVCLANTQRLIVDDDVFALFCYVGTPTTVKVLPMIDTAGIPLLGMFTGANALRTPYNKNLINVRASYYEETGAAVRHLVEDLGLRRIAVFYQYDAFGFDGLTGTELALKKYGLEPVARGSFIRGTLDIGEGFERIRRSDADAVVMIGTYEPCALFIHKAGERKFHPLFYTVSFVGARELARRLDGGQTVIMSQVVPPPDGPDAERVLGDAGDYIRLLHQYWPEETPNFVGLEGYVNARILVEGLRRAGRDLTREGFIRAVRTIHNYVIGPDIVVSFDDRDNQGMDRVFFTRLENDRFALLRDWKKLREHLERAP